MMHNKIRRALRSVIGARAVLALLPIALLAARPAAAGPIPVTMCGANLNAPGSYCLTGDLNCPGSGIAIRITASNVDLDLNGYTLSGDGTAGGIGIRVGNGVTNVRIRNGDIDDFDTGILFRQTANSQVTGLHMFGNGTGIELRDSNSNLIQKNKIACCIRFGIDVVDSNDNRINNNAVIDQPDIVLTMTSFIIVPPDAIGIRVRGLRNQINYTALYQNQIGVLIRSSDATLVCGSPITDSVDHGIVVESSTNTRIRGNNRVLANGGFGIVLRENTMFTLIEGNVVSDNGDTGIQIGAGMQSAAPSKNTVKSNFVRNNGDDGIAIRGPVGMVPGSTQNTIRTNRVSNSASTDMVDGNVNCDANVWSANFFGTRNQPCIH